MKTVFSTLIGLLILYNPIPSHAYLNSEHRFTLGENNPEEWNIISVSSVEEFEKITNEQKKLIEEVIHTNKIVHKLSFYEALSYMKKDQIIRAIKCVEKKVEIFATLAQQSNLYTSAAAGLGAASVFYGLLHFQQNHRDSTTFAFAYGGFGLFCILSTVIWKEIITDPYQKNFKLYSLLLDVAQKQLQTEKNI